MKDNNRLKNELNYKLCKYYNLTQEKINSIVNDKLWFSLPVKYNDPYEFYFNMPSLECDKVFDLYNIHWDELDSLDAEYEHKFFLKSREILKDFSICCFAENNDNLLMWSHYADSHQGICVEYDFSDIIFSRFLEKVDYQNNVITFDFNSIDPVLCTKSTEWSYEHEWRMIYNCKCSGLQDAPPIRAIYFGVKCDTKSDLVQKVIAHSKKNKMSLYQMEQSESEYKLIPRPLK